MHIAKSAISVLWAIKNKVMTIGWSQTQNLRITALNHYMEDAVLWVATAQFGNPSLIQYDICFTYEHRTLECLKGIIGKQLPSRLTSYQNALLCCIFVCTPVKYHNYNMEVIYIPSSGMYPWTEGQSNPFPQDPNNKRSGQTNPVLLHVSTRKP